MFDSKHFQIIQGATAWCVDEIVWDKDIIKGGSRHSTEVAFTLLTPPAQVRNTAPEILLREIFSKRILSLSDVAVLIDSKDNAQKA